MKQATAVQASFVIERSYAAAPARVFAAWARPEAKAAWFGAADDGWTERLREFDFRVGGRERLVGAWSRDAVFDFDAQCVGTVSDFDCTYHDIVPDQRIVYCYAMKLNELRISVSLATVEFKPAGAGTRLVFTEQAVFLDGYEDAGSREQGTAALLEKLGATLRD